MPETSMNKDHFAALLKNEIGVASNNLIVNLKPKTKVVDNLLYEEFGLCILVLNQRHLRATRGINFHFTFG